MLYELMERINNIMDVKTDKIHNLMAVSRRYFNSVL